MTPVHRHLVLIGGQRCGTTWLHRLLSQHEDITPSTTTTPEPKFFLTSESHEEYDKLFPAASYWLLDKSTTYLERPDAAARAFNCVPDALIVAVLRDPVQRALSNWRFSTQHRFEDLPASQALTEAAEQRAWDNLSTSPYHYLQRGNYFEMLRPWIDYFGDQVVVLQYEQMVQTAGMHVAQSLLRHGIRTTDDWPVAGPAINASVRIEGSESDTEQHLTRYFDKLNQPLAQLGIDLSLWSS
jgi:hypothetical protein